MIDLGIVTVIIGTLLFAVFAASGNPATSITAGFVGAALYHFAMVQRTGQTIGKRLNDTIVVDALTGELVNTRQAFIRSAPWIVAAALAPLTLWPAVIAGSYSSVFASKKRQGIHDLLAKTLVVPIEALVIPDEDELDYDDD
jgi:uncharacterized RDD family membrane protein YckC